MQFGVKYSLTLPGLLKAFGFGWRNLLWLNKPLGKLSAQVRTIALGLSLPKSADDLIGFFNIGKAKLAKYVNDMIQVGIDFKLTTLVKSVPKVQSKLRAADSMLANRENLLSEMTSTFCTWLEGSYNRSEKERLEDEIMAEALSLVGHDLPKGLTPGEKRSEWYALVCALYPNLPENYEASVRAFYELLWNRLYGPALAGYHETVRDVCFNVEAMAGKHRGNSMLVLPSFHSLESKVSYGFFQRYWDFLGSLEDLATASPSVINFSRPEGLEGVSQSQSAVTPLHLRYYRLWSGIIQGSLPVLGLGLKTDRVPTGLVPSETRVEDEDEDY